MRVLLCHNPTAGAGDHSAKEIIGAVTGAGFEVEYFSTDEKEFPDCLERQSDLIIAAGGDGTVAKVVKKMPDREVPLAIIPLGTANNVARSFGISGTPQELVKQWDPLSWRPLHIGLVEGDWGKEEIVEAAGLGLFADLMRKTPPKKRTKMGKLESGREALRKCFAKAEEIDVSITVDGMPLPCDSVLDVEILNLEYTGPALALLPGGFLNGQKLGIVVMRRDTREAVREWLKFPQAGAFPISPHQGETVEIEWSGAPLRLDDEPAELSDERHRARVTLDLKPIRILIPED